MQTVTDKPHPEFTSSLAGPLWVPHPSGLEGCDFLLWNFGGQNLERSPPLRFPCAPFTNSVKGCGTHPYSTGR